MPAKRVVAHKLIQCRGRRRRGGLRPSRLGESADGGNTFALFGLSYLVTFQVFQISAATGSWVAAGAPSTINSLSPLRSASHSSPFASV